MINGPVPYIFEPSHQWLGSDGPWSTFLVNVGTPPQTFHILPATNVQETWVPLPQACAQSSFDCPELRGVPDVSTSTGFDINGSTSWIEAGTYNLVSEEVLGYYGNGFYGFDSVEIGNSTQHGPRLEHQVVAGIVDDDFWLGIFGLGPKPANFSTANDPQPSFMRTLVDQKLIPSLSYGYTAGSKKSWLTGSFGSLTLGGYDASRLIPNNLSFSFASDDSRSLTVGLQSITAEDTLQGDVTLLGDGILSLIDSTVPHIWLPPLVCDKFASAFGLIYDNSTDLYLVNDTIRAKLNDLNPWLTFKLGNDRKSGPTIAIGFPYTPFDLEARYPYYTNSTNQSTNYFPIRRAQNDTQYTLGRTFLQGAYLIADYERQNFSVSEVLLVNPPEPRQIIPIHALNATTPSSSPSGSSPSGSSPSGSSPSGSSPSGSTTPSSSSSSDSNNTPFVQKLSTGIIVAIAILSTIFLVIASLVLFGLYRRYRRSRNLDEPNRDPPEKDGLKAHRKENTRRWVHELDAASLSDKRRPHGDEHPAWKAKPWTRARRQELQGSAAAQEMEGGMREGSLVSPSAVRGRGRGEAPWEDLEGRLELPGHEARSKRGSERSRRSRQVRGNLGRLIG